MSGKNIRDTKDANVPSLLTARDLDALRVEYNIPSYITLHLPTIHQRVNHVETRRIAVHEEALRVGVQFPFTGLVGHFLRTFQITFGQMTPNSWRIVREIELWSEKSRVTVTSNCLLHLLTIKRSGNFLAVQGGGNSKIVSGMLTSNKG